jgi:hypothetical protein
MVGLIIPCSVATGIVPHVYVVNFIVAFVLLAYTPHIKRLEMLQTTKKVAGVLILCVVLVCLAHVQIHSKQ